MVYYKNYANQNNIRVTAIKSIILKVPNEETPKEKIAHFCFPLSSPSQSIFPLVSSETT